MRIPFADEGCHLAASPRRRGPCWSVYRRLSTPHDAGLATRRHVSGPRAQREPPPLAVPAPHIYAGPTAVHVCAQATTDYHPSLPAGCASISSPCATVLPAPTPPLCRDATRRLSASRHRASPFRCLASVLEHRGLRSCSAAHRPSSVRVPSAPSYRHTADVRTHGASAFGRRHEPPYPVPPCCSRARRSFFASTGVLVTTFGTTSASFQHSCCATGHHFGRCVSSCQKPSRRSQQCSSIRAVVQIRLAVMKGNCCCQRCWQLSCVCVCERVDTFYIWWRYENEY